MPADRPRTATSARMRSTQHLFSGVSRIVHSEKGIILHISSFVITQTLRGESAFPQEESHFVFGTERTSINMNFFRGVMGGQAAGPQPSGAETVRNQPG